MIINGIEAELLGPLEPILKIYIFKMKSQLKLSVTVKFNMIFTA